MIINEALNRVTFRRIERRFLPSVRAASENVNRKRIQDLSLEVARVRSEMINIFFCESTNVLCSRFLFFFFFSFLSAYIYVYTGNRRGCHVCIILCFVLLFFFSSSARDGEFGEVPEHHGSRIVWISKEGRGKLCMYEKMLREYVHRCYWIDWRKNIANSKAADRSCPNAPEFAGGREQRRRAGGTSRKTSRRFASLFLSEKLH